MFKIVLYVAASAAFSAGDYDAVLSLTAFPPSSQFAERINFMRAVSAFKVGDRPSAFEAATDVVEQFRAPERRHDVVCRMILEDLKGWKDKDLSAVGRQMGDVVSRLDVYKGGPVTQDKQRKILDRLDEMIKEEESPKGSQEQTRQPGQGRPRERSELPTADGSQAKVDERKLKELAENWGKMPELERTRVIQEYTREFPAKYRPLIESYFKSLNK